MKSKNFLNSSQYSQSPKQRNKKSFFTLNSGRKDQNDLFNQILNDYLQEVVNQESIKVACEVVIKAGQLKVNRRQKKKDQNINLIQKNLFSDDSIDQKRIDEYKIRFQDEKIEQTQKQNENFDNKILVQQQEQSESSSDIVIEKYPNENAEKSVESEKHLSEVKKECNVDEIQKEHYQNDIIESIQNDQSQLYNASRNIKFDDSNLLDLLSLKSKNDFNKNTFDTQFEKYSNNSQNNQQTKIQIINECYNNENNLLKTQLITNQNNFKDQCLDLVNYDSVCQSIQIQKIEDQINLSSRKNNTDIQFAINNHDQNSQKSQQQNKYDQYKIHSEKRKSSLKQPTRLQSNLRKDQTIEKNDFIKSMNINNGSISSYSPRIQFNQNKANIIQNKINNLYSQRLTESLQANSYQKLNLNSIENQNESSLNKQIEFSPSQISEIQQSSIHNKLIPHHQMINQRITKINNVVQNNINQIQNDQIATDLHVKNILIEKTTPVVQMKMQMTQNSFQHYKHKKQQLSQYIVPTFNSKINDIKILNTRNTASNSISSVKFDEISKNKQSQNLILSQNQYIQKNQILNKNVSDQKSIYIDLKQDQISDNSTLNTKKKHNFLSNIEIDQKTINSESVDQKSYKIANNKVQYGQQIRSNNLQQDQKQNQNKLLAQKNYLMSQKQLVAESQIKKIKKLESTPQGLLYTSKIIKSSNNILSQSNLKSRKMSVNKNTHLQSINTNLKADMEYNDNQKKLVSNQKVFKNNQSYMANQSYAQRGEIKMDAIEIEKILRTPKKQIKNVTKLEKGSIYKNNQSLNSSPIDRRKMTKLTQPQQDNYIQNSESQRSMLSQYQNQNMLKSTITVYQKNDITPLKHKKNDHKNSQVLKNNDKQQLFNKSSLYKGDKQKQTQQTSILNQTPDRQKQPIKHNLYAQKGFLNTSKIIQNKKQSNMNVLEDKQNQLHNKECEYRNNHTDLSQNSIKIQQKLILQPQNHRQDTKQIKQLNMDKQLQQEYEDFINQQEQLEIYQQYQQEQKNFKYAIKLVQKSILSNFTQKFVTEIMQESTDAIYKFEDDAITIADKILKGVLKVQIDNIIKSCVQEELNNKNRLNIFNRNTLQDNNKKNKKNILETILYEKMLKDYIIEQDQQQDNSNTFQSLRKNNANIEGTNQSFINKFKNSINSSSNDKMSDNQQELSKILCESSVGLDKVRKSVIKQQSEQYLMNENQRQKQNNTVMYRFQDKYQNDTANVQMIFQQEESLKESLRQNNNNKHIIQKQIVNQGKFNKQQRNENESFNTSRITILQQSQQTIEKNYNSSEGCFYDQVEEINNFKNVQNPNQSIIQNRNINNFQNNQSRNRSQSSDFQENLSEVQSGHDFKSKERKITGHIFKHKNVNALPIQNNYLNENHAKNDNSYRKQYNKAVPFQQKQIYRDQFISNNQKDQQKLSPQKTPKMMKDQKTKSFTVFNNFQNQFSLQRYEMNQQEKEKKQEFDRKKSLCNYLQDEQIGSESQKIRTSEIHKKMSQITNKNTEDQKYETQLNPNQLLQQIKKKYKKISPILPRQNSIKRSQNSDQQELRNDDGVYEEFISKLHRKVLNPSQKIKKSLQESTFSPTIQNQFENDINHNEYLDEFQLNNIINSSRVSVVDNNKLQVKNTQDRIQKQSIQVYSKQKQSDDYQGQQKNQINTFQQNRLMNSHILSQPLSQKNNLIKKQFWFQQ